MLSNKDNKFERTRLLSTRAAEIAAGAPIRVDVEKKNLKKTFSRDYVKIAEEEVKDNTVELELYREK